MKGLSVALAALAAIHAAAPSARAQSDETQACVRGGEGCIDTCTRQIDSRRHKGPVLSRLLTGRAACLRRLGRFEPALADLARAIAIDRNNATAYFTRSAVYGQQKRYDLSIADATRAIRLNPKEPVAYLNRCISHYRSGQPRKAVADCRAAVRIDPKFEPPRTYLDDMCATGVREAC